MNDDNRELVMLRRRWGETRASLASSVITCLNNEYGVDDTQNADIRTFIDTTLDAIEEQFPT